jgi:uncharacterized CHY-type Zn-finger protein
LAVDQAPETKELRIDVCGVGLDPQTRCAHYGSRLDIIAIKMKCCRVYYACKECHDELANHDIEVWPRREWEEKAVLCGACTAEMTIRQYLGCANACPHCESPFNPGCRDHHHLYFEMRSNAWP